MELLENLIIQGTKYQGTELIGYSFSVACFLALVTMCIIIFAIIISKALEELGIYLYKKPNITKARKETERLIKSRYNAK